MQSSFNKRSSKVFGDALCQHWQLVAFSQRVFPSLAWPRPRLLRPRLTACGLNQGALLPRWDLCVLAGIVSLNPALPFILSGRLKSSKT
eukprot:1149554-Pelagomonas_calceolata.AAC.1